MKIRLRDIPTEGLKINDTISLAALNSRMDEGQKNDIEFISAPRVLITVVAERHGAEINGIVESNYIQPCVRCLEKVAHHISRDLNLIIKTRADRERVDATKGQDPLEDDIGIIYLDGNEINLDDIIQEALILGLSVYGEEHENCQGLPESCEDNDFQNTNKLGNLLKNAGIE